jgi:hypothetical protein
VGQASVDRPDPALVAQPPEKNRFPAHSEPALHHVQGRGSLIFHFPVRTGWFLFSEFLVSDSGEVVRIRSSSLLKESSATSWITAARRSNRVNSGESDSGKFGTKESPRNRIFFLERH